MTICAVFSAYQKLLNILLLTIFLRRCTLYTVQDVLCTNIFLTSESENSAAGRRVNISPETSSYNESSSFRLFPKQNKCTYYLLLLWFFKRTGSFCTSDELALRWPGRIAFESFLEQCILSIVFQFRRKVTWLTFWWLAYQKRFQLCETRNES